MSPITAISSLGGFAALTSGPTLGAYPFSKASATGNPLIYAPSLSYDCFEVYWSDASGARAYTIDGASPASTATDTSTTAFTKGTVCAASVGTHTLRVDSASAAEVRLLGIIPKSSATKRLIVINAGAACFTTNNWAQTTLNYSPRKVAIALNALYSLQLGINDFRVGGGATPSGYLSQSNSIWHP